MSYCLLSPCNVIANIGPIFNMYSVQLAVKT